MPRLSRVEEYLDAGCDSNCVDSERARNTPLHWAAAYSTLEVAQLLIGNYHCHVGLFKMYEQIEL